jgi:transcriptional regulator with XRE-family HTH domain
MLNNFFRETMDSFGIKGKDLAQLAGCSYNNISEIRHGKSFPPINRFWELVEMCEQLAPGFKDALATRISNAGTDKTTQINSNKSRNSFVFQVHGNANDFYKELRNISPEVFDELLQAIVLKVADKSAEKKHNSQNSNNSYNSRNQENMRETFVTN